MTFHFLFVTILETSWISKANMFFDICYYQFLLYESIMGVPLPNFMLIPSCWLSFFFVNVVFNSN